MIFYYRCPSLLQVNNKFLWSSSYKSVELYPIYLNYEVVDVVDTPSDVTDPDTLINEQSFSQASPVEHHPQLVTRLLVLQPCSLPTEQTNIQQVSMIFTRILYVLARLETTPLSLKKGAWFPVYVLAMSATRFIGPVVDCGQLGLLGPRSNCLWHKLPCNNYFVALKNLCCIAK